MFSRLCFFLLVALGLDVGCCIRHCVGLAVEHLCLSLLTLQED